MPVTRTNTDIFGGRTVGRGAMTMARTEFCATHTH